jgi:nucleoside-diphosphate-sugar epimerase
MKLLIVGATGFVGSAILEHILTTPTDPDITHVYTLTRQPIAEHFSDNPKVTSILHADFLSYPPELLEKLEGVEACLWCIGGRHTQTSRWKDDAEYVKCSVEFTVRAAESFRKLAKKEGKMFRFVFCSGHATELDQEKNLWVMGRTRKVKVPNSTEFDDEQH